MNPLSFNAENLFLVIYPDTETHLNGHAIITHTYSLYKCEGTLDPLTAKKRENSLLLIDNKDPDYLGQLTFELPDKLFNYAPGPYGSLTRDQVELVIEFLSDIRSNPALWQNID